MRHALFVWLALTLSNLLAVDKHLVADDPPFVTRTSFEKLSDLFDRNASGSSAAASCASTACHGGPRPGVAQAQATRGAEYPLWLQQDPHAQAYRSLSSELGLRILHRLGILEDGEISNRAGLNNCLSCHNSTEQSAESNSNFRAEGVACDRCHGPSQAWRSTHYTNQWPATVATSRTDELGFVRNQDLLTRARMCASCHIGDRSRNMNHDMLAAGHPPLLYEFTTYHNRLPKHWRDARSRDKENYESTVWFVGQIAALEAQAALIESRATLETWPEFAHLDCAGCHQPLKTGGRVGQPSNPAGWSHWHRWGVEAILQNESNATPYQATNAEAAELKTAINHLADILHNSTANRRDVQTSADRLQQAINRWSAAPALQPLLQKFNSSQLANTLLNNSHALDTTESAKPNWESLSQLYLAGLATRGQWPARDPNPGTSSSSSTMSMADQLRRQLLFSPNQNVPQYQVGPTAKKDAMAFLKALQQSYTQPSHTSSSRIRTQP